MSALNHLNLFSGIGGFALGLQRAGGYRTVAFSEIDKHGCDVLADRFPGVPNLGAVETVTEDRTNERIDIITAGFPCQDLSVAGKRAGLKGERSRLFWHVVRLASKLRPEWLLLENVPGLLSSNEGRDMGTVVGALQDCGYSVAWRVLDARYFGLAQQRRRVWFVCHPDPERAGAVLFEPERGARNSQTSEEARPDVAYCLGASAGGVSGKEQQQTLVADPRAFNWQTGGKGMLGYANTTTALQAGQHPAVIGAPCVAVAQNQRGELRTSSTHPALTSGGGKPGEGYPCVAHTLSAEGFDASEDGTGRGTPIVAAALTARDSKGPLPDRGLGTVVVGPPTIADGMRETSGLPRRMDGARYRSLGNAVPVPVVEWIARRIRSAP